jgi:hypothetical protein
LDNLEQQVANFQQQQPQSTLRLRPAVQRKLLRNQRARANYEIPNREQRDRRRALLQQQVPFDTPPRLENDILTPARDTMFSDEDSDL